MAGPEVIKIFSYSTQLSMKFFLLINIKMPTIVGILIFISRKNFMLSYALQKKSLNWWYLIFHKRNRFHSQLSWAWKKFYNLRACLDFFSNSLPLLCMSSSCLQSAGIAICKQLQDFTKLWTQAVARYFNLCFFVCVCTLCLYVYTPVLVLFLKVGSWYSSKGSVSAEFIPWYFGDISCESKAYKLTNLKLAR